MQFTANEDQTAFLAGLDQIAEEYRAWRPAPDWARYDWSAELDGLLERTGFYDCAKEESLGLTAATMMTHQFATLPVLVECAASSTLRALFAPDLPRPMAVIEGRLDQATAFLPVARSVIWLDGDRICAAELGQGDAEAVESIFAYPMGVLAKREIPWREVDAEAERVRDVWRVALAAEMAGCLKGGLNAVVEHVHDRHQFGRPLGSFQAIQHRLAGAAVKIEAAWWLTLRAAQRLGSAEPATALGYMQEAATRITYDLHQFMGAMGLTLEHPLHRWTYRVRLLKSAMGGASVNLGNAAIARWRAA